MIHEIIQTPQIYAQWAELFETLKKKTDDQEVLQAMQNGTLEWQAGVAERFVRRLMETVNSRLNAAIDTFQKTVQRGGSEEREYVQALISLRKELNFLHQLMEIPAMPAEYQKQGIEFIKKQADSIQESLEKSARNERSGKLASIIRNHKVNAYR